MANKSYRVSVEPSQGIGFLENTGSAWVKPDDRAGTLQIIDHYGFPHMLVFDSPSGLLYDIATLKGSTESGLTRAINDKEATNGTGGTAVAPSVTFREERGSSEHFYMLHKRMHLYARPYNEANQGAAGYDANGFLTDTAFAMYLYDDGDTTAEATAADVNPLGPTVFDRDVRAHRIQPKISCNKGDHIITGRQNYFVSEDVEPPPGDIDTTEDGYQDDYVSPTFWASMSNSKLINRYDGSVIDAAPTTATGPDSQAASGWTITAAQNLGSIALGVTSTFLIWYNGAFTMTIGGVAQAVTGHATSGSWTLAYVSNANKSGALVITPTGASSTLYDIRCFDSTISSASREYLFDDVIENYGNALIPRS